MIDKLIFCNSIEAIRVQLADDKKNSEIVAEIFQSKEFNLYNNDRLVIAIIDLLSIYFDRNEITHYIFDLNFGKPSSDSECETAEKLYDRLIKG